MGRPRRYFIGGQVYEVCFRVRQGLPFPPNRLINALILSAIARAQRDSKVIICHHLWMGNHAHMILVAKDAEQFKRFYTEVQKNLTDSIKRLLGFRYLSLWEGRPMAAMIGDPFKAVQRIAYLYANPARASLVDRIELYPGASSYHAFKAEYSQEIPTINLVSVPYIRCAHLNKLGTRSLNDLQASELVTRFSRRTNEQIPLETMPNAWMDCFDISDSEVANYNKDIQSLVEEYELEARLNRALRKVSTFGTTRLCTQPILKPHQPEKKEQPVIILASTKKLRAELMDAYRYFVERCEECFAAIMLGKASPPWPPGAFRPPGLPQANAILI